jgi:hypothetical protein
MATRVSEPLISYTDQLLAEIAVRVQLSPSRHRQATQRYQTVANWLERDESWLKDRVSQLYPQGSMAIGATILSRDSQDRYDIDIAAELLLPEEMSPKRVLDGLYETIKGTPGSQYYQMTRRRSRCVTIEYAEMHMDITPVIRRPSTLERESWIFENRKETPQAEARLVANPYGLAEWYNQRTHADDDPFANAFRVLAMSYDTMQADVDPVPEHEQLENKSQPTIVLQLIKQWRNFQYEGKEDQGPPSVILSRIVAESSNPRLPLSKDLEFTAIRVADYIEAHGKSHQPITNPVCPEDVLSDRWKVDGPEARIFVQKLRKFSSEISRLNEGCDVSEAKGILAGLFGEYPTREAVNRYGERVGQAIRDNQASHKKVTAGLVVPAAPQAHPRNSRPTRQHQFHSPRGI